MEPTLLQLIEVTPLGLAALAIAFAFYVLKYKRNGNGNGVSKIEQDLSAVKSNHLVHIQNDINRLLDGQNKLISYQEKQMYILEEIRNHLLKQ